jgi:hypothetical protein
MIACIMLSVPRGAMVLVVVAGVLSITAGGASAAGWLAPTSTSPAVRNVDAQDVGLDAEGNAVAVWTVEGRSPFTQVATRPVGGSWSVPVALVPPGEDNGWDPEVAVGANGDAVVVWSSVRRATSPSGWSRQIVFSASREAGGGWSAPVALSDEDGIAVTYEPEVVVDAQGNATAIWSEETGTASVVRTRTRPKGGDWGEPVDLTDSRVGIHPQLAVDAQGDVTAVWNWNVPEYGSGIIQTNSRPAAGTWGAQPVDISGDESALDPQVAVDPQGDAVAVWWRIMGGNYVVRAARRAAGSGWDAAVDLSHGAANALNPQVAIDPQGTATAVWESYDAAGSIVRSSTGAAGVPWSDPTDISVRDDGPWPGSFPQVAVDPQGNVTADWRAWFSPGHDIGQAARREAGTGWSAPVDLGPNNGVIEAAPIAVDPQGYATVVWTRGNSLYSTVFDPVAPLLRDLAVPASGTVGQPVAMATDLFDVWSPVTTSWDFGDGRSGSGATVDHCYRSPGRHTVTITGTDPAANATDASRTITIEPDPALDPASDPCPAPDPPDQPGPPAPPGPPDQSGPPAQPGPSDQPDVRGRSGPLPRTGPAAPVVSDLQQSSSRWRTQAARRGSRVPLGTTFRLKLDRPARVRLAFSRIAAGRRVGTRCAATTKATAKKPRCDRFQARGTLEIAGKAGANSYNFKGKIRGRTLEPGRYRLLVTALADGKTSAAVSIGFSIMR